MWISRYFLFGFRFLCKWNEDNIGDACIMFGFRLLFLFYFYFMNLVFICINVSQLVLAKISFGIEKIVTNDIIFFRPVLLTHD